MNNEINGGLQPGIVQWFRPGEYQQVERVLQDIRQLNISRIRTGISWADWHSEGTSQWYDWLLPQLDKQVEILPCFLYTPPSLGLSAKVSSPPKDSKAYADFLDVMITRYGQFFEWVELWNEPNNQLEYDYTLDFAWQRFADMIGKAGYWAKKRGKKTLLGGMSPVDPNWLQMMIDLGIHQVIDAYGIHGFPGVYDQQWKGWQKSIAEVRQVLDQNKISANIWITEAGFSTWQHHELKQWQEFKNLLNSGLERLYWYSMYDLDPELPTVGGFHMDERDYYFGIKTADGKEKLLYKLWKKGLKHSDDHPYLQESSPGIVKEKYSLITGGAGFIGTNLAKALLESGKKVMIFDSLARPGVENNLKWLHERYKNNLNIHIADIRNRRAVEQSVKNADEIFNFSAQVAVTTSLENPVHDFDVNIGGTMNLLEAIRKYNKSAPLIFTSTNKVYGGLSDLNVISNGWRYNPADNHLKVYGIGETRPLDFHSPYGCSKGAADQYVLDYCRSFGLNTIVFRMSCIYGPHQLGTEDQGWVAHFVIRILEGLPITIYGNGQQVRDILYVEDLVKAFISGIHHMDVLAGNAFNIGGGPENTASLLEVINLITRIVDMPAEIHYEKWRTGDQLYYVSDIRKFGRATDWQPKFSVEDGVSLLISWLSENRSFPVSHKKKVFL